MYKFMAALQELKLCVQQQRHYWREAVSSSGRALCPGAVWMMHEHVLVRLACSACPWEHPF